MLPQALAMENKLSALKVDDLKAYLRAKGLKLTGKTLREWLRNAVSPARRALCVIRVLSPCPGTLVPGGRLVQGFAEPPQLEGALGGGPSSCFLPWPRSMTGAVSLTCLI